MKGRTYVNRMKIRRRIWADLLSAIVILSTIIGVLMWIQYSTVKLYCWTPFALGMMMSLPLLLIYDGIRLTRRICKVYVDEYGICLCYFLIKKTYTWYEIGKTKKLYTPETKHIIELNVFGVSGNQLFTLSDDIENLLQLSEHIDRYRIHA